MKDLKHFLTNLKMVEIFPLQRKKSHLRRMEKQKRTISKEKTDKFIKPKH